MSIDCALCGTEIGEYQGDAKDYLGRPVHSDAAHCQIGLKEQLAKERAKVAELKKDVQKFVDTANTNATERNEAWTKVEELEKSESEAWAKYSELLKDRNALLDQTRTGPLRAEEWQVRAIRAERRLADMTARLDIVLENKWQQWLRME